MNNGTATNSAAHWLVRTQIDQHVIEDVLRRAHREQGCRDIEFSVPLGSTTNAGARAVVTFRDGTTETHYLSDLTSVVGADLQRRVPEGVELVPNSLETIFMPIPGSNLGLVSIAATIRIRLLERPPLFTE